LKRLIEDMGHGGKDEGGPKVGFLLSGLIGGITGGITITYPTEYQDLYVALS
jgi:hypothetical protein